MASISGKKLLSSSFTMQPKAYCNPLCCVPVFVKPCSFLQPRLVCYDGASFDRDKPGEKFRSSTPLDPPGLPISFHSGERNRCSLFRDRSCTHVERARIIMLFRLVRARSTSIHVRRPPFVFFFFSSRFARSARVHVPFRMAFVQLSTGCEQLVGLDTCF